ncbi:MAG: hypothetical protein AUK55_12530 [Syntrophobacteraceae bacterium CG2_30_61_12]|nr:MAG: hypothetical protein AUK55_12530 [Syntrophobacteraceae bacterium CG2_30_61_12]PIU31119.1 MAG: hypothetical protein COT06_09870 [Syntrophobacteraceae bacterium CG07_land_8_20_14_0_80_61_8]
MALEHFASNRFPRGTVTFYSEAAREQPGGLGLAAKQGDGTRYDPAAPIPCGGKAIAPAVGTCGFGVGVGVGIAIGFWVDGDSDGDTDVRRDYHQRHEVFWVAEQGIKHHAEKRRR